MLVNPYIMQTIIPSTAWQFDGASLAPGSTVIIPEGNRGALLLKNLHGTAEEPIIVINDGKVVITALKTASYGLKTLNCQHFKILGNGTAGLYYGIEVNGGNISVTMDGLSSDFEVAYLEVHESGFAGIMAKTDPTCDVATQRGNFTLNNPYIHHNYIYNTGGEGIYVGNSFYMNGVTASCGKVWPHDVVNADISYNITNNTGCEGIQLGSATSGANVYCNTVTSPGVSPFASGQNNGIQIGEGTGGNCYRNLVKDAPGCGIIVLGLGNNLVYSNIIVNADIGIFADSRYTPGPYFMFVNNTIVGSKSFAIKLNSVLIPMQYIVNNAIVGGTIKLLNTNVHCTQVNNYVGTAALLDSLYRPMVGSPLLGTGVNVSSYGVTEDYFGNAVGLNIGSN